MGIEFMIREAEFDDAPAIAQVSYLTWLHAYRGIIPDAELDALNLESVTDKWVQILSLIFSVHFHLFGRRIFFQLPAILKG